MSDRSKEQTLAATIVDKRLRRALGKLLIKGHCIGSRGSVLTIAPEASGQPEYVVSLSDDTAKLLIEGQDVSNSSKTFTRARQAITEIEKRVDEAPCLIPGFPADATPGVPALERLRRAINASIKLGLPFIVKAPGHLFPKYEGDNVSSGPWATTVSSGESLRDPGERFSMALLPEETPIGSFMDAYADPNMNIMTVPDLRRTPSLNRMLSSVTVNERFVGMFSGTDGSKAASVLRSMFSSTGQEWFSSFIAPLFDDLFSPEKWKENFGDISHLTMEQQERLLSPPILFPSVSSTQQPVVVNDVTVDLGHWGNPTASLWIDQARWFLDGPRRNNNVFKNKMNNWSKPAGLIRNIFEEHMPGSRRSWGLSFTLPDRVRVEESSLFSLYGTILLARLFSLPSGKVSSADVVQAQRVAIDVVKEVVSRAFEIHTGLFTGSEVAKGMLAGKKIPHAGNVPESEIEETVTPLTDEVWTKNMEKLAKGIGAILETFYSDVLRLHREHAGKYENLSITRDEDRFHKRPNHHGSWSNNVSVEYGIKAQGTRKGGVVVSYGYDTLQNSASNDFHSWRTFITFKPDLQSVEAKETRSSVGASASLSPGLIVNMTGATAKTIALNIKKALSGQKNDRTGKTAELDALLDRIIRDCDRVVASLIEEADAHIKMLGRVAADEQERFYEIMGSDFPEEYFEAVCTMSQSRI